MQIHIHIHLHTPTNTIITSKLVIYTIQLTTNKYIYTNIQMHIHIHKPTKTKLPSQYFARFNNTPSTRTGMEMGMPVVQLAGKDRQVRRAAGKPEFRRNRSNAESPASLVTLKASLATPTSLQPYHGEPKPKVVPGGVAPQDQTITIKRLPSAWIWFYTTKGLDRGIVMMWREAREKN
jgi:hypothetical protein